ncbi:hypothetical protein [Streptomyces sp. NPDC053079]|uniref:hypothetical protein n=1 Tax=Streptomyces sp. NPDC053079 TaxID=3365697 RepID=UPI0037D2873B
MHSADEPTSSHAFAPQERDAELRAKVREVNGRSGKGRDAAGLRGSAARSPVGCGECAQLEAARREAVAGGDAGEADDATIAVRRHFRDAHLLPGGRAR